MAWFFSKKLPAVDESAKKELPEGLWIKCDSCGEIIHNKQLINNYWTCPKCSKHFRIGSDEYIKILLDENSFRELDKKMESVDILNFVDTQKYSDRLKEAMKKTGLKDAVRTGIGKINGLDVAFACMDFKFIGGSMGSVVGEKISRCVDAAMKYRLPVIIVSSSGGARMMESALSLMQMAKTSARLAKLSEYKLPYISVLTNPTTGGVTASFAMLGDVIIAEPGALIGFAGPRVIKQTIGKELPEGFQTSEFLLEKGFVDFISHRKELKNMISRVLDLLYNK